MDGPLASELAGNMVGIENDDTGRISPSMAKASGIMGIVGGALSIAFLVWAVIIWSVDFTGHIKPPPIPVYEVDPRAFKNRNKSQISMEEMADDFSTYVKYASILETLCAPIQLDDSTYKAMQINFDDAVLHETLKFKGNSKNIPKYKEKHLIL